MRRIQKTISEFISEGPVASVTTAQPVSEAISTMRSSGSDALLVLDGDKLAGIFTERDFLNRVTAAQRRPSETPIAEVMTARVHTLRPSDCISYAINHMAVRGFRNIPIVDEDGRPIAVLDVRSVMDHIDELFAEIREAPRDGEASEWVDIGGGA